MFIPPWAAARGVPPEINSAWVRAVAGAALTVMVTGASCEAERLQDLAGQIRPLAPAQVSAAYPDLRTSFTDLNRLQAIETCYWLNTPAPDCADQQEVKLVADDLHLRGALYRTGGLVLGVGAIGLLGSALRGLKTP